MRRTHGFALGFAALLAAAPAHAANNWWLVYGWGEKPARALVFVDEDTVQVQPTAAGGMHGAGVTAVQVSSTLVYESPSAPDSVKYVHQVDCSRGTLREYVVATLHRDTRVEVTPAERHHGLPFVKPAGDAWEHRTVEFACNRAARTADNAMLHLGKGERYVQEIAWRLWPDGSKPVVAPSRTAAQISAEIDAIASRASALLARARDETVQALGERQEFDQRKEARVKRWPKRGPMLVINRYLESFVGFTHEQVVAAWGVPGRETRLPHQHLLTYEFGHDQVRMRAGSFGASEIGRSEFRCWVVYEIKYGKAIDYSVSGNYCVETFS